MCDHDGFITVHPHWLTRPNHLMVANGIADVRRNRKFNIWIGNFSSRTVTLPKRMRVALDMPPPAYTADASPLLTGSQGRDLSKERGDTCQPTSEFATNRKRRRRAQLMQRKQQQRQRNHINPTNMRMNKDETSHDSKTEQQDNYQPTSEFARTKNDVLERK